MLSRGKPPLPAVICATPAMAKRWFNSSIEVIDLSQSWLQWEENCSGVSIRDRLQGPRSQKRDPTARRGRLGHPSIYTLQFVADAASWVTALPTRPTTREKLGFPLDRFTPLDLLPAQRANY